MEAGTTFAKQFELFGMESYLQDSTCIWKCFLDISGAKNVLLHDHVSSSRMKVHNKVANATRVTK